MESLLQALNISSLHKYHLKYLEFKHLYKQYTERLIYMYIYNVIHVIKIHILISI